MNSQAIEDSANGKHGFKAFAIRFSLFVAVALYAGRAMTALEWLRGRRATAALAMAPGDR